MLLWLREKTHGWFSAVLFTLIAISFLFFGAGDFLSSGRQAGVVMQVGALSLTEQNLEQRLPYFPSLSRSQVIQQWVQGALWDQGAKKLGFAGEDKALSMDEGLRRSAFILASEEENLSILWNARYSGRYQFFLFSDFTASLSPTKKDLHDYFQEHRHQYREPAKAKLTYVLVDKSRYEQREEIEQWAFDHPQELKSLAKEFKLTLLQATLVDAEEQPLLKKGAVKLNNEKLRSWVFQGDPSENEVFSLDADHFAVVHVLHVDAVHEKSFQAVESQLRKDWVQAKAQVLASNAAEALILDLKSGSKPLSRLSQTFTQWGRHQSPPKGVSEAVYAEVLAMPNPQYAPQKAVLRRITDVQGEYVVLVEKVSQPVMSAKDREAQKRLFQEMIVSDEQQAFSKTLADQIIVK
jgi:hypothetical protein